MCRRKYQNSNCWRSEMDYHYQKFSGFVHIPLFSFLIFTYLWMNVPFLKLCKDFFWTQSSHSKPFCVFSSSGAFPVMCLTPGPQLLSATSDLGRATLCDQHCMASLWLRLLLLVAMNQPSRGPEMSVQATYGSCNWFMSQLWLVPVGDSVWEVNKNVSNRVH